MSTLTLADFQGAAFRLRTGVAEIRAVTQVESGGAGFDNQGRVIIRFEPHLFHRYTNGVYDQIHPEFSFPVRRPGYPVSVDQSWQFYNVAKLLDLKATRLATSFGMFQILGSNFRSCHCLTLDEFVSRMCTSEAEQLNLFGNLILDWGLDDELRNHDWATFAKFYNGPNYRDNQYDLRMQNAYNRFSGMPT